MGWRTIFGNLTAGNESLSLYDTQFNDMGLLSVVPCTASGTNVIALTPQGFTAVQSAYANYQLYGFVAANTSTGPVSINVAAIGALNLYLSDGVTQATTGNIAQKAYYEIVYNLALNGGAGGFQIVGSASAAGTLATRQVLTSGSAATYTTPANCRQVKIRAIGAGGGGGGSAAASATNGGTGGTTSFNAITGIGGTGGTAANGTNPTAGGAGGTGGAGSASFRLQGGSGSATLVAAGAQTGGAGGNGSFGGGAGSVSGTTSGGNGSTNTGGGGAGGISVNGPGSGGGAGEYFELIINSPSATYTYTVGAAGTAGTGAAANGGAGGSGLIIVDEFY
jgi:hypothetical protein